MSNLSREQLIKALVKGLKLDDNVFNYQAVAEETDSVQERDFMDFYKAVMSENTYGNGLQAIIKVAERFKPVVIDLSEIKANELIDLVHSMNNAVYQKHLESGISFDVLLDDVKFPNVDSRDIAILNEVEPHYNLKSLIAGINHYGTSINKLTAFKQAIIRAENNQHIAIDSKVSKMIGRK